MSLIINNIISVCCRFINWIFTSPRPINNYHISHNIENTYQINVDALNNYQTYEYIVSYFHMLNNRPQDDKSPSEPITWPESELSKKYNSDEKFKNLVDQNYPEIICPIFMQIMENPIKLKCNHTFDEFSLNQWIKKHNTCPLCRQKFNFDDFVKNEEIIAKVNKLKFE